MLKNWLIPTHFLSLSALAFCLAFLAPQASAQTNEMYQGVDPNFLPPTEFPCTDCAELRVNAIVSEFPASPETLLLGYGNDAGEGFIARVDAVTGEVVPNPPFSPYAENFGVAVTSIVLAEDARIVIGGFRLGGLGFVARLGADMVIGQPWFLGLTEVQVDGPVNNLALDSSGNILVGGNFTSLTGENTTVFTEGLGRLSYPSMEPDTSFSVTIRGDQQQRGWINAVFADGADIVAGGGFDRVNGMDRSGLARFVGGDANNLDTSYAQTMASGDVMFLGTGGANRILVGGDFGLRRISGTQFDGFNPPLDNLETEPVNQNRVKTPFGVRSAIFTASGQVLVGGIFDTVSGQEMMRNNITLFNDDGSVDATFTIQAGGPWLDQDQNQTIHHRTEVNALGSTGVPAGYLVGGLLTGDFGAGGRTSIGRILTGPAQPDPDPDPDPDPFAPPPIVFSSFVVGGGFTVVLLASNPGPGEWTGRAELDGGSWNRPWSLDGTDQTGMSGFDIALAANQTQKFVLTGNNVVAAGWLRLQGDAGTGQLATSFFYNFVAGGELIDSTGVAPAASSTAVRFPVERSANINTSYAIQGAADELIFSLYDEAGSLVQRVTKLFNGAQLFNETFDGVATEFIGSVQVESASVQLEFNGGFGFFLTVLRQELIPSPEGLRFQLTSVPATPVSQPLLAN